MKVSIIVPVFNEEKTLVLIISHLQKLPFEKEIIIVDDCSQDFSFDTAKKLEEEDSQIRVIRLEKNHGKGAAVRTGIEHSTGEIIVVQDADLEYHPNDLITLVSIIKAGKATVVFGSRYLSKQNDEGYLLHRLGNFVFTWFSNRVTGLNLTDVTTCYRVCHKEIFEIVTIEERRFGIEVELVGKIGRLYRKGKCRIQEVPIRYFPRGFSEGKKITWKDSLSLLKAIVKYR
ncbi:MAG: glycosyltransferase family 2 protein [Chloroherpetonaceae bacterium]|nr:glycosyltransferase family 2 protein [Chloroherpetonaceae bacterium]